MCLLRVAQGHLGCFWPSPVLCHLVSFITSEGQQIHLAEDLALFSSSSFWAIVKASKAFSIIEFSLHVVDQISSLARSVFLIVAENRLEVELGLPFFQGVGVCVFKEKKTGQT